MYMFATFVFLSASLARPITNKGWSPRGKLGRCEGDCDRDSDCWGTLKCFQRYGYEHVPGCHGRTIRGYDYCYDVASLRSHNWMMGLDGSRRLSEYSIPGTHDTAARGHSVEWVNCQDWSIWTQLIHGVRFFDMRIKLKHGKWVMVHGDYELGFDFERDMLNPIYKFLHYFRHECIIMQIQRVSGDQGGITDAFRKYIDKKRYRWLLQDNIPTLNQCRGKIFAVRKYWSPPSGISVAQLNEDKVQGEWNLSDDWRRRRRWGFFKKITQAITKPVTQTVNHVSNAVTNVVKPVTKAVAGGANDFANWWKKDFVHHSKNVGIQLGSLAMQHVGKQYVAIVDFAHGRFKDLGLSKGKSAAAKKLRFILSFHYAYLVTNFEREYLHVNYWSYFAYSRLKAPKFPRDNAADMRKLDIIPRLEGSNLGICVFDFPTKFQLEQVLCRNYGRRNGKCFK